MKTMNKHQVRTPDNALAYLVDCTLATVQDMAMLKSRKQSEFERQKMIAQQGINWMIEMDVDFSSTRAYDVVNEFSGSVEKYANKYDVKFKATQS